MFDVGKKVRVKIDKRIGIVIGKTELEKTNQYMVFHGENAIGTYYEEQLESVIEKNINRISRDDFFNIYSQIKMKLSSNNTIFSLNSGNIKFIPFQFRPLSKLLKAERPRILIADEVGVGKTIETGLIMKEFEKRENIESIIIICPKDLTTKWQREMKYRFDEHFTILTSSSLLYCLEEFEVDGCWPVNNRKCIINLEMIRNEKYLDMFESLNGLYFDMLILDEAHHVINPNSKSHKILEYFCNNSDIAVFLSATPLQLGSYDLYSLLNLLMPEEYLDYNVFENMAEPNHFINLAIRTIRKADDNWQIKTYEHLSNIYVNRWAEERFSSNPQLQYWLNRLQDVANPLDAIERVSCLTDLEQLHTFSGIINRTKRKDIGEFTIREPITVVTKLSEAEESLYKKVIDFKRKIFTLKYDERTANFVMSTIERQFTSSIPAFAKFMESFVRKGINSLNDITDSIDYEENVKLEIKDLKNDAEKLISLAKKIPNEDLKLKELIRILDETINGTEVKKVLIFSYFKNTLNYLKSEIDKRGYRVELITGDTSDADRENYRRRFRDDHYKESTIDVLLCSEVGCEGLDYEFCNRMVNYDIPWNPMKIEQRIGRIDRFGQKSPKVQIFNFITENTVEEKIFFRCYERLGIFNSTVGDLEGILGTTVTELTQTAMDISLTEEQQLQKMNQLADNAIRLAKEQRNFEEKYSDLMLLDNYQNEKNISRERDIQSLMFRNVIESYIKSKFSNCKFELLDNRRLKIRINKNDKNQLYKDLNNLKRSKKIDRNSKDLIKFEKFLLSERQSLIVKFENDEINDDNEYFISNSHPLAKLALLNDIEFLDNSIVSIETKTNILKEGKYIFGCFSWIEKGYRKNENIMPILINFDTGKEVEISSADFETILVNSKNREVIEFYNENSIDQYAYNKQLIEKKRLDTINSDIINRQLATINQYYMRKIFQIEEIIEKSKNDKIIKMQNIHKIRLQTNWDLKVEELNQKFESDIIVKKIVHGILEVKN